jgi:putative NIF3 family GTP cyclohydrolase 1 type 2
MNRMSRRGFVRLGLAPALASPTLLGELVGSGSGQSRRSASRGGERLTAQEIVDRIKKSVGVEWNATTVDTFKAGDPSTVVTGVVTTSLATIDVMRRAVKSGANLIVTSGPTFYSRTDGAVPPTGQGPATALSVSSADPVLNAKHRFIRANNLVVWRFSDHWRLRAPDPFVQGLTDALGWAKFRAGTDPRRVTVPPVTLDALVTDVKTALNARGGMRVIGDPRTRVRRIGVVPGSVPIHAALALLPEVDVMIAGEVREWESAEYARDTVTAGVDKGLILIGRTLSEDAGMKVCAAWLQTIAPGLPCRWMAIGDPYWRPA